MNIFLKSFASICMLSVFIFGIPSFADEKSGAHIYKDVCSACHEKGVVNAPKLGDQVAWGKLISEGQVIITAHGYVGVRAMPPRGGKGGRISRHISIRVFPLLACWLSRVLF